MNNTSLSLLNCLRGSPKAESWDRLVGLYALLIRAWLRKYDLQDSDAYDAHQAGDFHFMVMEHVDGVDLSQTVKDRGVLPVAAACDYIRQAAIGVQHAHQRGMVHRDIKPRNLMVTSDGTVKILDFGPASLAPEATADYDPVEARGDLTAVNAIMGTPDFISPEQADDARKADIRSDIYSLGATLYFLLAGRPPFAEGSLAEKLKSHPPAEPRRWKPTVVSLTAVAVLFVTAIIAGVIHHLQTDQGGVRVELTEFGPPSLRADEQQGRPSKSETSAKRKTTEFLIEAVQRGDLEAVKAALKAGVEPNGPANRLTALHHAVAQRISEGKTLEPSAEIVRLLIEAGANVNAADYLGQTPLEWAAKYASPEIVEMLVKAGANVNAESRYGTVLMAGRRVEIAKLLIEGGADVNAGKYTSALANAAKYGNAELIRLLVENGARVNDPKDPPIHWAGKPEAAEALIEAGADVNLRNAKGETALHLTKSTWSPITETVKLLIDAGAEVTAKNATGSTPLHAAVQQGQPEIAKLLIAAGADVDARDRQGNTPLSIAQWALSSARGVDHVENAPFETSVQLLVDAGAKDDGRTELQQAVAAGDLEQVEKLIAAKADVNEIGPQRITSVHLASEKGHAKILAALIEAGANVDAVDAQLMKPLHLAANAETARLLIAKGAKVNAGTPSPLYMATMNGKADVVRELLRNDANAKDSDCATMLNWATFAGQIEVVKELFELRDAKTLLAVKSTYSPLHVAASGSFGDMGASAGAQRRLDIAKLLVANGADVNARWGVNVNPLSGAAHMIGATPLMFASQRGEAEMVKFLLDQQADVAAKNESGQTALHFAAQYGQRNVVELLLKTNADVNALTREAKTPLDLARDAAVEILLIQKGGKTASEVLKDAQR